MKNTKVIWTILVLANNRVPIFFNMMKDTKLRQWMITDVKYDVTAINFACKIVDLNHVN